jgi:hypothetical protein
LPRLEKLEEQYKDRPEIQFLTLNIDDNPRLIEPVMAEKKVTLIVLPAYSYVSDTLKLKEFPQNWIVDAAGVVKLKGKGYDATEKWETGMAEAIGKVK